MFDYATSHDTYDTWTSSFVSAPQKTTAHAFMERLAADDAFRAQTQSDPVAAAALYGFHIDAKSLPAGGITLPSKELLREHLDEAAARFQAAANVIIIFTI
jgi:putative modified peptide